MTLATHGQHFIDHCRIAKNLSSNTLRSYESDIADFLSWTGAPLRAKDATEDTIRGYTQHLMDERQLKPTTVRRRLACLKLLFRWMESQTIIASSVFRRLELSIRLPRRLPRALENEEARALLRHVTNATEAFDYDMALVRFAVVVIFITGLRVSELVSIDLSDVIATEGVLNVHGKGNRERRVYLAGTQALELLRSFLELRQGVESASTRLLVRSDGHPVSAAWIRLRLRVLASRARILRHVTPHMLRHTAATQLLEAGVDIRFVQRLLGHASIATTQIYAHVSDSALKLRLTEANTLGRVTQMP